MILSVKTVPVLVSVIVLLISSCSDFEGSGQEENNPAFEKGRAYLKVGKQEEALDEFLSITRRMVKCPKSHLEAGRLFLSVKSRQDPVSAIYHFRRYLMLEPESREAPKVKQLIVSAEKEIIRRLPGKPYAGYLDGLEQQEENIRLRREIADLKARLGIPLSSPTSPVSPPASPVLSTFRTAPQIPTVPAKVQTYVVQKGDNLYVISRKFYGDSSQIDRIFQANRDVMSSKNNLKIGQILRIPPTSANP